MRLFLLVGPTLDDFWLEVLEPLLESREIEIVGACVDRRPPAPRLRKLRSEVRKGRGGYVVVMAANSLLGRHRCRARPAAEYLREHGIDALETDDLYSTGTLSHISARRPDCMFRSGFGLIREPVLSMAPKGVISYHHGDIRRYRGQPVAFWEIYNGERELGVTVQVLSPRLDAGKIVVERAVPIRRSDSWRALERRARAASTSMVLAACLLLADPGFAPTVVPDAQLGVLYTLPTLRQWLTAQRRVLTRRLHAAIGSCRRVLHRSDSARPV